MAALLTDPTIIEAAARALEKQASFHADEARQAAMIVLAVATPLIEEAALRRWHHDLAYVKNAALEEAATRLLELAREERNLDGATINRAAEYLDTLRALKEQP